MRTRRGWFESTIRHREHSTRQAYKRSSFGRASVSRTESSWFNSSRPGNGIPACHLECPRIFVFTECAMRPWNDISLARQELPFGWYVVGEINPRRFLLGVSWEASSTDTSHHHHSWRTIWVHFFFLRLIFSWRDQRELPACELHPNGCD